MQSGRRNAQLVLSREHLADLRLRYARLLVLPHVEDGRYGLPNTWDSGT